MNFKKVKVNGCLPEGGKDCSPTGAWKAQSSSSRSSRVRRRLVGPQIPSSIHPWRRGLNSARFRQQEASGFANLAAPLSQALRAASIASRSPAARVRTARFHRASGARKTVAQRGRCGKRRARGRRAKASVSLQWQARTRSPARRSRRVASF